MTKTTPIDEEHVSATPLKSFFVTMLTRDISLEDAILDLLDNCIDGVLRSIPSREGNRPYHGYKADISLDGDHFSISDNCGGIPWTLHKYAFHMGRKHTDDDTLGSVGYYGIGMKRAIFKMGKNCRIRTKSEKHQYEVNITSTWLNDEYSDHAWDLPVNDIAQWSGKDGTIIEITELYDGISKRFNDAEEGIKFKSSLETIISTQYAVILGKGFEVTVNGKSVAPKDTTLIFDSRTTEEYKIQPYVYQAESRDGVKVFVTVGFTRPIPTQSELDDDKNSSKYSSMDAGWTIICNDRVVVYCNRDELTGWGEAGVPRYHNQFIAISGIVEFLGDPGKLPTTTTKRGLEAASPLYLQVKNKMREGMKIFTSYTNKWKGQEPRSKQQIAKGEPLSLDQIKEKSSTLAWHTTPRSILTGKQFMPKLPMPRAPEPTIKRICFSKKVNEIKKVATYLQNPDMDSNDVGEKCFDIIYEEAKKQ